MTVQVRVRVTPHAHRERFEQVSATEFSATVKEPAQRNEANLRVQRLVAQHFNVPLTSVRFLTGMRGKKKVLEVVQK